MSDKNKNKKTSKYHNTITKMTPEMNRLMDMKRFVESGDKSGNRNSDSKAYGYYQILPSTLASINKARLKEGLPILTLNTREEQHEAMRHLMVDYKEFFDKSGVKNPKAEDYYGIHFLGPTGYKKLLDGAKQGKSLSESASTKAIEYNSNLLNGSPTQALNNIKSFVNDGFKKLSEQPKERIKSVEAEKKGYVLGTATPLDLRAGSYKGDGKEEWLANTTYFNGTKIGEHLRDYIPYKSQGTKTIIKKGEVIGNSVKDDGKIQDLSGGNYNFNEANSLYQKFVETPMTDNSNSYADTDFSDFNDFSAGDNKGDFSIGGVKSPRGGKSNHVNQTETQIFNNTALYNNKNNAYSDTGNLEHLNMTNGKDVVPLNSMLPLDPRVSALEGLAINQDMPKSNTQFEQGGNLNNSNMKKKGLKETNDSLIEFNEGGTHEENPQGGIPQNTNPDGTLNKVEEGETKHNDYVFSNSLKINNDVANQLNLPEEVEGMTFAEASKFLNKELEENQFDPIVKRTVEKQLNTLKEGNEIVRQQYEDAERQEAQAELEAQSGKEDPILEDQDINQQQYLPQEGLPQENQSTQFSEEDLMMLAESGEVPTGQEADQVSLREAKDNMFDDGGDLDIFGTAEAGLHNLKNINIGDTLSEGLNIANTFNLKDRINNGERINANEVALSGVTSGASLGSKIGSVIPGVGNLIGGAAGGLIGGVAGLLTGKKAARRAARRRTKIEGYKEQGFASDFRTGSGQREDDFVQNFYTGGPLTGKKSFSNPNLEDPALAIEHQVNNLPEESITSTNNTFQGTPGFNLDYVANTANSNKSEGNSNTSFKARGGNPFRYAGVIGSYLDYKDALKDKPTQESYQTSGRNMIAEELDENIIMSQLRDQAYSNRLAQQNMAGGSSATARANMLASDINTGTILTDALLKTREFNMDKRKEAFEHNNKLTASKDAIINKQRENNYANASANKSKQELRKRDFVNSLGELGKELDNQNKAYNLSGGYDQYGRKIDKSYVELLLEDIKNRKNNKR